MEGKELRLKMRREEPRQNSHREVASLTNLVRKPDPARQPASRPVLSSCGCNEIEGDALDKRDFNKDQGLEWDYEQQGMSVPV